ncbi:MAG: HIT domain-containing protein [Candidatus Aenigmarchaeota archaeon]|nr:HIT domain-containing protein [Candidatus Aenigmarchaeota archaeon]
MYTKHLWTDRIKWLLRKKKDKECVFCRIVKGFDNKLVLKKGEIFVVLNKFPYNTGHLLVFPKRHVENFEDLDEKELIDISITVKKCIVFLRKALKPEGFNIGVNLGEVASASIPHLHYHIVPRFKNDAGFMEVISSTKVMPESLKNTYKRLKKFSHLLE